MTSIHRDETVRLLVEHTHLSIRAEKLLNMLITANPVALRGQPTMIAAKNLIDALDLSSAIYPRNYQVLDEIIWIFKELAQASWKIAPETENSPIVFLDTYWMSEKSVFIHFQLNKKFLAILSQIGWRS